MPGALLVVDVQNGFVNPFTAHVPGRIRRLVEGGGHDPVLFTRFVNAPGGPYRRFLDWHACAESPETDLAPELAPLAAPGRVFEKPGYTGIPDDLAARLRDLDVDEVTVVGIDTDMCVLKVAMDVFDLGIRPVVLVDCCASTAGLQAHLAGLAVLARNIGADQLRDAGLAGGYLGAPPEAMAAVGS
ncbi:MAG: cysteine hydrolase [Chloroflexota bacterium]|nr:cysteine hydrolase [Chloroflexota bacterium]